ncbi:MAG: hypothetical protein DGJ47_000114 [Rickettsiaceae bacterium]
MAILLKAIIFSPLLSAFINGVFGRRLNINITSFVSSFGIILPAIGALYLFWEVAVYQSSYHLMIFSWIKVSSLSVNWSIYVDQLTSIMFLLVTTVSAVVHIYSLGYMKKDGNIAKFLSYLSLFTFFMLALVSADNFIQLFFGWEGVGLCSYLLIGYYNHKESANLAAVKAFMVNRVSDFAFILGVSFIFFYVGSVEFGVVFDNLNLLQEPAFFKLNVLDLSCLLLFIGCMGKSAQVGLHIWLPDAMEGPTPVSALIHAATMVTAGVFLVARCSYVFEYTPIVMWVITIVGAVTCLFAALIAVAQTDLKKIIAYSTCSQLGYMFFACGVSAYQVAMFHLVTHGFFKALLFLSAGSVIYATNKKDIFDMGGLRKKMPVTYANFLLGSLAIIGIYPFAGFYSKDLVLERAYLHGGAGEFAFIFGLLAAILTAIYSFKIIIVVFHRETSLNKSVYEGVKETPWIMSVPMFVLLLGTLFSGMVGYYILDIANPYGFFGNSIFNLDKSPHPHVTHIIETLPLLCGVVGSIIGVSLYLGSGYKKLAHNMGGLYTLTKNKFYIDELYNHFIVRFVRKTSCVLKFVDKEIIDKFGPNGVSRVSALWSRLVCKIQTGYIYNYVLYMLLPLIVYITFIVLINSPKKGI